MFFVDHYLLIPATIKTFIGFNKWKKVTKMQNFKRKAQIALTYLSSVINKHSIDTRRKKWQKHFNVTMCNLNFFRSILASPSVTLKLYPSNYTHEKLLSHWCCPNLKWNSRWVMAISFFGKNSIGRSQRKEEKTIHL